MKKLEELQKVDNVESRRIVTEHLRSSMMIINDGGKPSNVDRGYILRRLLRRMTRHLNKLGIDLELLPEIIDVSIDSLKELYPELAQNRDKIVSVIVEEKNKFMKTLQNGEREFSKAVKISKGSPSFILNVFLISLGITTLPKSSILLTTPVAFIFPPFNLIKFIYLIYLSNFFLYILIMTKKEKNIHFILISLIFILKRKRPP